MASLGLYLSGRSLGLLTLAALQSLGVLWMTWGAVFLCELFAQDAQRLEIRRPIVQVAVNRDLFEPPRTVVPAAPHRPEDLAQVCCLAVMEGDLLHERHLFDPPRLSLHREQPAVVVIGWKFRLLLLRVDVHVALEVEPAAEEEDEDAEEDELRDLERPSQHAEHERDRRGHGRAQHQKDEPANVQQSQAREQRQHDIGRLRRGRQTSCSRG